MILITKGDVSLYQGDEFLIFRVFVSPKSPFTTKNVKVFPHCVSVSIHVRYILQKHENFR